MSQPNINGEGRKRWSTPALEQLDLSGTRSGSIPNPTEVTFPGTPGHPAPFSVAGPHHS